MTEFVRKLETPFKCGTAPLGFHGVYGVAGHEFLPRNPLEHRLHQFEVRGLVVIFLSLLLTLSHIAKGHSQHFL